MRININTLRPRQNGHHFADVAFKPIFLNENIRISIKISLKFVPEAPIKNIPALVQIMAWRRAGDKPLSEPMMDSFPTHICVTRPQWVNSLRQTDTCMHQQTNHHWFRYGFSPGRRHAIIWTNAGILLIGPSGTNFSEILTKIYTFSSKKMLLKLSSGKWGPFCLCLMCWYWQVRQWYRNCWILKRIRTYTLTNFFNFLNLDLLLICTIQITSCKNAESLLPTHWGYHSVATLAIDEWHVQLLRFDSGTGASAIV